MNRLHLAGAMLALALLVSAFSTLPEYSRQVDPPYPPQAAPTDTTLCPALFTPGTATVHNVTELIQAVNNASPGATILIADGTYNFYSGNYLWISASGVTLRSASGNRDAVIIDGNYEATELITIAASNVTIADLTLQHAYTHPIHVVTGDENTENTLIYNVHIIDPREQGIKINPNGTGFPDNGIIACSHIELTDAGRPHVNPTSGGCYTGGVDAHQARGWTIRDNLIEGFWCDSGLSEHGIHMWRGCRDTTVERNQLNNNARGIGFGLATDGSGRTYSDNPCPSAVGYVDDFGGIIRNNFVFANDASLFASNSSFDSGISLWNSCGTQVLHNTVASTQTPSASSIEWRFDNTDVDIIHNLVTYRLWDRGGTFNLVDNLEYQPLSLFVDGSNGDLHLVSTATAALDQVTAPTDVTDDFDGNSRPIGSAADIGADEYGIPAPAAVTDLRVSNALTGTGTLTTTLRWTPPTNALTTTLRYSTSPITPGNWNSATLLTNALSGSADTYLAVIPYSGGTVYFALKTKGVGGESALSNIAFWPFKNVYLPLIFK